MYREQGSPCQQEGDTKGREILWLRDESLEEFNCG